MPSDKDKNWTPEQHLAHTYTDKEVSSGNKILKDFNQARSLSQPESLQLNGVDVSVTQVTMRWDLKPPSLGQTSLKVTPKEPGNDIIKGYGDKSERDAKRGWKPKDLSRSFNLER